jgi:cytidylate kinase
MVVITVSGIHGTGKTTAAKHLAKKLKLRYVGAGEVFRQLAKEKKMPLKEFSKYAEKRPSIDLMIDNRTAAAAKENNVLIDGRLSGWMAKRADFRILLTAPLEVRVKRMAQREGRKYRDVLAETEAREKSETMRFKRFYGVDVNDLSAFDLVLNTRGLSIDQMTRVLELAVSIAVKGARK